MVQEYFKKCCSLVQTLIVALVNEYYQNINKHILTSHSVPDEEDAESTVISLFKKTFK